MKKFLTRKRDKQRFPVKERRTGIKKEQKLNGTVTPRLARSEKDSEYRRILQEKDRFNRKLKFAAFLADRLRKSGVDSVLVGGSAVEMYTNGDFPTADMDIDVSDLGEAVKLLKNLSFRKTDSLWFNPDLDIAVDLSTKGYSGDVKKLRILEVGKYRLKVAGVEDLIVNRLYSAKFWKSNLQRDIEEAAALLEIFKGKLDNNYLITIAKKNDVEDLLKAIRETQ